MPELGTDRNVILKTLPPIIQQRAQKLTKTIFSEGVIVSSYLFFSTTKRIKTNISLCLLPLNQTVAHGGSPNVEIPQHSDSHPRHTSETPPKTSITSPPNNEQKHRRKQHSSKENKHYERNWPVGGAAREREREGQRERWDSKLSDSRFFSVSAFNRSFICVTQKVQPTIQIPHFSLPQRDHTAEAKVTTIQIHTRRGKEAMVKMPLLLLLKLKLKYVGLRNKRTKTKPTHYERTEREEGESGTYGCVRVRASEGQERSGCIVEPTGDCGLPSWVGPPTLPPWKAGPTWHVSWESPKRINYANSFWGATEAPALPDHFWDPPYVVISFLFNVIGSDSSIYVFPYASIDTFIECSTSTPFCIDV